MKLKNILLSGLSLVLVAALAIGGTVAYLQDDDSDVNVMTLGNVSIEQIEQERDENGNLVDFKQAKPAYPVVGPIDWANSGIMVNGTEYKMFTPDLKNVVDKIVTVKNTGKSEAFVRTVVALEAPNGDPKDLIHINWNSADTDMSGGFKTTIDGVDYVIFVFTYKAALASGAESAPSLLQVFLDSKTTNEDCAAYGDTWEILVTSQAVQAAGFANAETALDAAFGDITTTNHPWSTEAPVIPAVVEDAKDLDAALNAGDDVILNANLSFSSSDTTANSGYGATGVSVKGSTLDGAGHSLGINNWGTWDAAVHTTGGTIKNLTINSGMRGIFMGSATEDVYIDNVVIDGTVYTFNSDGGNKNYGVYISNSTLNGWTSHSDVHKEVVYTNCIFGEGSGYAYCRPYGPTTFVGCDFEAGFTVQAVGAVTFENCTIGGVALTADNLATLVTSSSIGNASVK